MSPSINMVMLLGAAVAWAENAPMGYGPPPAAMTTAAASPADCAATCFAAYRDCQTNPPDSNKSLCASNLAKCLNYNPFDNSGTFVTPTACSASAPATATAPAPAATTAPAGDAAQCAATCFAAYRDCQTNPPDSNKSLCASNLASCLGYNPFDNSGTFVTPTACSSTAAATAPAPAATTAGSTTPDACAKACNDADDKCRVAPDANMSFCASELAKCLGYNPYDNSGTFVTPTACSTSGAPAPTAPAPAATTAPASGGSTPDACAKACNDADDKCRFAPDANMSFCASELAKCLGYNPYDNSGTFVTPTACSTSGAPAPTGGAGGQPAASSAAGGNMMPTGTMNMATHTGNATATSTQPAQYTGAASLLESYGSFVAFAAGAVAMMV